MSSTAASTLFALVGLAVAGGFLRTLAIARRADASAERHWRELTLLRSDSGIAFFPTAEARLELEVALTEVLEIEPRRPALQRRSIGLGIGA